MIAKLIIIFKNIEVSKSQTLVSVLFKWMD